MQLSDSRRRSWADTFEVITGFPVAAILKFFRSGKEANNGQ